MPSCAKKCGKCGDCRAAWRVFEAFREKVNRFDERVKQSVDDTLIIRDRIKAQRLQAEAQDRPKGT